MVVNSDILILCLQLTLSKVSEKPTDNLCIWGGVLLLGCVCMCFVVLILVIVFSGEGEERS